MAEFRVWFGSFSIVVKANNIIEACIYAVAQNPERMYRDITEAYNIAWHNE